METTAVHRIIEQQAAIRGEAPALADQRGVLTYRDLNQRANAVARCLMAHGFRRGMTAVINMPRSTDLAVMCLGVMKAGGAYAWLDDSSWPQGISVPQRSGASDEMKVLAIDVTTALRSIPSSSPNLPILTRGSDIACVIGDAAGRAMLVPHSTITALRAKPVPQQISWSDEPGALDLWMGLMAGATVTMAPASELTAA